jgi:hypothetical protein
MTLPFKCARNPRQMGLVTVLPMKMGMEGGLARVSLPKPQNAHSAARAAMFNGRYMEPPRRTFTLELARANGGLLAISRIFPRFSIAATSTVSAPQMTRRSSRAGGSSDFPDPQAWPAVG